MHLARCEAGDMQAIKELANRLDGRPALQILEHSDPDSNPIRKIVNEFCRMDPDQGRALRSPAFAHTPSTP